MQTFCTDTVLVLHSSWRGSYRTSWPTQTPSLHPLFPPQCWPKEKSGQEIVPKWLSITDKGNVSSDYPTLSSDRMGSTFPFSNPERWLRSLWQDHWVYPTPSFICRLFTEGLFMAAVTPFHNSHVNPEPPASSLAGGKGTKVYWDVNVLCPLPRMWVSRKGCEEPRMGNWNLGWWIQKGIS